MTTDPIADMLTRIRNGLIGRLEFVDMPVSKVKVALAKTMRKEGFIRSFDILEEKGKSTLRIQLAYIDKKEPAILHLKRISRPGLRIYTRRRDVPRVQSDLGIAILSTSKGVMTGKEAWQRGLGERCSATYGEQVMSRVGKMPIALPKNVQAEINGQRVTVKGPKGELSCDVRPEMTVRLNNDHIAIERSSDQPRHRALHGLMRSLLANMVTGVSEGFSKELELQGVGYRAAVQGDELQLSVGHMGTGGKPYVGMTSPPGISFEVEGTNRIIVRGADKQQVGQVAADIRAVRPPDPYKGKGIRYSGEYVRRKAGKAGKATAT